MAFSFKNAAKWSRFEELSAELWFSQDLGSAAFVELHQMIGLSDWRTGLPFNATPREVLVAARNAMIQATGYDPSA